MMIKPNVANQEFLEQSSADDVQIDMDVPRTINRHVMFRRRYRGGLVFAAQVSTEASYFRS